MKTRLTAAALLSLFLATPIWAQLVPPSGKSAELEAATAPQEQRAVTVSLTQKKVVKDGGGRDKLIDADAVKPNDVLECGTQLMNAMLANGIALPEGRGPELHDRYVYTDQSGAPHELRVCLVTVPWSIPGASVGTYRTAPRHVLRMEGLTPSAAISLDALVDGRVDARFGDLREDAQAASTSAATAQWSRDANARFNNLSEGQEVELVGFLLLGR